MTEPSFTTYEDAYSVASAGTRVVQRLVEEPNFKWFCEREGCGWSGDGYTSFAGAQKGAERHQHVDHGAAASAADERG